MQPYGSENAAAKESAIPPEEQPEKQPERQAPVPEPVMPESGEAFDPGTFDAPDIDGIPLYPGLSEQAGIGEIPEEDGDIPEAAYEEFAA